MSKNRADYLASTCENIDDVLIIQYSIMHSETWDRMTTEERVYFNNCMNNRYIELM